VGGRHPAGWTPPRTVDWRSIASYEGGGIRESFIERSHALAKAGTDVSGRTSEKILAQPQFAAGKNDPSAITGASISKTALEGVVKEVITTE
jgi:hypothetical protein